jgi:hypothetical protein
LAAGAEWVEVSIRQVRELEVMVGLAAAGDFIEFEVYCRLYRQVVQLLLVLAVLSESNMLVILLLLPMVEMEELRRLIPIRVELQVDKEVSAFRQIL